MFTASYSGSLTQKAVMAGAIRILTVDEQSLVQEGLAATIHREKDMVLMASARAGREAIVAARLYSPDVPTLDLVLPDMAGYAPARMILEEFSRIRIVAIASETGHVPASRALHA